MSPVFLLIHRIISKNRLLGLLLFTAMLSAGIFFALKLRLSEDISKVLPESRNMNNINFVLSNAQLMDKVIFNISLLDSSRPANPEMLANFARQFTDSIQIQLVPGMVQNLDKAPDEADMLTLYEDVYAHLPVFLTDSDYEKIDSLITPENIDKALEYDYKTLISPMGLGTKKMIQQDPLHFSVIALNKFRLLQVSDNFKLYRGFFMSKNERNLLLLATPVHSSETKINQQLFDRVDQIIQNLTEKKYPEIRVEYFGNAVVALGNAQRIKQDIILTMTLALIMLVLSISLFFRKIYSFLVIFSPVLFGAIVSLAVLYLTRSEVSAISLGIGSVLLGISVDYGIHVFSHFRENRDIRGLLKDISTPIVLGSITTAAAFFTLHYVNSQALNDLGLFAGVSVLAAAFFSLTFLPLLFSREKSGVADFSKGVLDNIASFPLSKNKILLFAILALTIVFYFTSKKVGFDSDMMKNNYLSAETSRAEKNLNKVTSLSKKTIYLVSPGKNLDEALTNNAETSRVIDSLEQLGIIQGSTVITDLFQSSEMQGKAIEKWNYFWENKREKLQQELETRGKDLGFNKNAFDKFYAWLNHDFKPLLPGESALIDKLILDNYTIEKDTLAAVINILKVNSSNEDISEVYKAFEGRKNSWVVDKRMITSEFVTILKNNINKLVYASLGILFVILLLAFGRIELTLITMIPMVFSWIWTIGIMGIFGISFNIFNIIILTFIFGLGIDYSIFIMRGLLLQYKFGTKSIATYKVSVIVSAITTLLGIGVLIFAKHPALRSIATMSIIGILSVIFITFTLLPAIFRWMVSYKKGKRNRSVSLLDLLFSIASLIVFVGGALLMTLLSFLIKIIPFKKKKKKYFFHVIFSKLTWFLIYMNFLSPKRIINPLKENYRKPAIIIANHQSHIDLMLMMLLNPKVLILTNRRNYTHPFYGKALQYADFIPSDMGYEEMQHELKELINDGYSFMIFPEGHRNDDGKIKRFHQGAFYLAEKLHVDILPIIIHGQNQLLKKSEFFLKRGSITTKFLPRIDLSEKKFGNDLREQTRGINKWFRKEYAAVREEFETVDYWADYIKKNFIYKGPVLEWYTKIKIRLEDNYRVFNEIIPRECTITDLGCGYGYLDFMLCLVSEKRTIRAIDYDAEKIAVASNCAIKTEQMEFVAADITRVELLPSDVFILNDVLHYLPKNKQLETLEKCIEKTTKNGMIIIRDSDTSLKSRHLGTRLSEFFSTNLGFNKTTNRLEFVARTMIEELAERHNLQLKIIDKKKMNSNLIYILRKAV